MRKHNNRKPGSVLALAGAAVAAVAGSAVADDSMKVRPGSAHTNSYQALPRRRRFLLPCRSRNPCRSGPVSDILSTS
jgi:hypothetical protein